MIDDDLVRAHRARAMTPDKPIIRGTAQNPDVFFQARETVNPYYLATPEIVQKTMDKFAEVVGRQYHLFDYVGAPDAERVIVLMGSGAETAEETVNYLVGQGEKVGLSSSGFIAPSLPNTFWAHCRPQPKPSPLWIAPKSPALPANLFIRTSSPASVRRWLPAKRLSPPSPALSVDATAFPPRNSRRR